MSAMDRFEHLKYITSEGLSERQLIPVARLLCETGYYEYSSYSNKLNLPMLEFQVQQTLMPYARYTHILIDEDKNEIVGFFIVATKEQLAQVERKIPHWYRDDLSLKKCFKKILDYYISETRDTDLISYGIAIAPNYRGKGLFRVLNEQRKLIAKQEQCHRIVFGVWEKNSALSLFQHCGAEFIDTIDLSHTKIRDRFHKYVFHV
jgi:GNAT superfamily N-acetyltransferase